MKTSTLKTLVLAATAAGGLASLASPSHAAMTADAFIASLDDLKRVCRRIEEPLWAKKHNYGCGSKIVCAEGSCKVKKRVVIRIPIRPRPIGNPSFTPTPVRPGGGDTPSSSSSDSGGGGRGDGGGTASPGPR
jgi:hypothetical protein